MHACNTLPQCIAEFMGSNPVEAYIFLSFFFFFFVVFFVFVFVFVFWFCFVLFFVFLFFFSFLFFDLPFFQAFRNLRSLSCLNARGLVPIPSFPKNAGIVKLLMPSETGRRPRSSMLSSAGNA